VRVGIQLHLPVQLPVGRQRCEANAEQHPRIDRCPIATPCIRSAEELMVSGKHDGRKAFAEPPCCEIGGNGVVFIKENMRLSVERPVRQLLFGLDTEPEKAAGAIFIMYIGCVRSRQCNIFEMEYKHVLYMVTIMKVAHPCAAMLCV